MSEEYPKMLYRDGDGEQHQTWGGALHIGGHKVDTLIVDGEDEELAAHEDGWREKPAPLSPLDHDLDGEPGGSLPRRGRPAKTDTT